MADNEINLIDANNGLIGSLSGFIILVASILGISFCLYQISKLLINYIGRKMFPYSPEAPDTCLTRFFRVYEENKRAKRRCNCLNSLKSALIYAMNGWSIKDAQLLHLVHKLYTN